MLIELNPDFEHGLLVDAGPIELDETTVEPRQVGYLGVGETRIRLRNRTSTPARALLIGGEPIEEEILMWWNFIGRSYHEIEDFRAKWQSHHPQFGLTEGYIGHDPQGLSRLPAPALPNASIKPRTNPPRVARPELNP